MGARELSINPEDVSIQPPNIENFLSPKLLQAIDQLSLRDKEMADLHQSSPEGTPTSPSEFDPHHQYTPGDNAVDPDYFDVVSAQVAAAATRAIDYWSPAVRPLGGQSAVSATAKVAAFPLAAGAADLVGAIGEPGAGGESAAPHVIGEESTADEDASGGDWWW